MAEEHFFKPGDVVKLRSGGPAMTVLWSQAEDVAVRWWNSAASKFEIERFLPSSLKVTGPDRV